MAASIKEIPGKIKSTGGRILTDQELFPALLIITVAAVAFGLGRLSALTPEAALATVPSFSGIEQGMERATAAPPAAADAPRGQATTAAAGGAYVGSKNSDKYHLPWCSGARRISEANKVWFASEEAARAAGYTPASNCPGL